MTAPAGAAKAAGVDWPARLVAVDGMPPAPTDDLLPRLACLLGVPVALTFAARETGATFTLTVPVQAPTFFDFASLFVVPYMVALVFAGLGPRAYALRWRTRAGRVYLIFCSALAVMTGTFLDMNATHALARLWAGRGAAGRGSGGGAGARLPARHALGAPLADRALHCVGAGADCHRLDRTSALPRPRPVGCQLD